MTTKTQTQTQTEYFVVFTDKGYWGSGTDWKQAAKNAHALNIKGTGISRGTAAIGYRVVCHTPITDEDAKSIRRRFAGTEDLKAGDLCPLLIGDDATITLFGGDLHRYDPLITFDQEPTKSQITERAS
jgi:hypothetical protein